MLKSFHPYAFSAEAFQELSGEPLIDSDNHPLPAARITELLKTLGCKSILIEDNYVDKDFKSEFAVFYAKRFRTPALRCKRLHFFSVELTENEDYGECPQNLYLGYAVIRPTEFNRIGRTVISPAFETQRTYVTCRGQYIAHILGEEFKVSGVPFVQQDTQVGVCAHAALWMVARCLCGRGQCNVFLPGDISRLAKSRQALGRVYPAEQGLTNIQMLDALEGMGLSAIHYDKKHLTPEICKRLNDVSFDTDGMFDAEVEKDYRQTLKLADIAYRYIESRLPVIFLTEDHAFVGVGHTMTANCYVSNTIECIPAFIVNDDACGPYSELPLTKANPVGQSFLKVKRIIVVTPQAALLCGSDAEEGARITVAELVELFDESDDPELKEFSKWLRDSNPRFRVRTYLLPSAELQRDFRQHKKQSLFPLQVSKLIQLDFPQFVWISEFYLFDKDTKAESCVGMVVIDSTAAKKDKMAMVVLLRNILFLFDRRDSKEPEFHKLSEQIRLLPKTISC